MSSLRRSAAVLLTRGPAARLELFLVERSPELKAFGGFWALPGGVVEADDRGASGELDEAALERCALRELFEEIGVLVPPLAEVFDGARRACVRRALLEEPADTGPWRAASAAIERARVHLRNFCRLTTPPFGPARFQDVFFHVELPAGEEPAVIPGELVRGRFFAPRDALAAWRAGALAIVLPVLYLLEVLAERGLDSAFEGAARVAAELDSGRLHPVRFGPGVALAPLRTPTLPPATTTNCVFVGECHAEVSCARSF